MEYLQSQKNIKENKLNDFKETKTLYEINELKKANKSPNGSVQACLELFDMSLNKLQLEKLLL